MASKRFHPPCQLVTGQRRLKILGVFLDVACPEGRFGLERSEVATTAIIDVDTPSNDTSIQPGTLGRLRVHDGGQTGVFEVVAARLLEVLPGGDRWRRVYRWACLVVGRPDTDPWGLFPALPRLSDLPEGTDLLADLSAFLRSGAVEGAVARFDAEGAWTPAAAESG